MSAEICYQSEVPFLQLTSSVAPRSDPRELALATAEALNGLRAKVPRLPPTHPASLPSSEHAPERDARQNSLGSPENRVFLGPSLMLDAPALPPVLGAMLGANLGVTRSFGFFVDSLWPVQSAEFSTTEATASIRTAWVRVGPRASFRVGHFDLTGAALVGPALTWATATANPPRIGTADVATSAVFALKFSVEYPTTTPVFAYTAASASTLVPRVQVDLGSGASEPLGRFLLEVSVGLGVRWRARD